MRKKKNLTAYPLPPPLYAPWGIETARAGTPLDLAPVLAALELEHRKISAARVTCVRKCRGVFVCESVLTRGPHTHWTALTVYLVRMRAHAPHATRLQAIVG